MRMMLLTLCMLWLAVVVSAEREMHGMRSSRSRLPQPHLYEKTSFTSSAELLAARDYNGYFSRQSESYSTPEQGKPRTYEPRGAQDFLTRDSRLAFVRKVYTIFTSQIATTILVTYILMNNQGLVNQILRHFDVVSTGSFLLSFGVVMALVSIPHLRYTSPINFILLGIYTLLQSIMVGTFSTLVSPRAVCLGSMHTLSAFAAITLYSFQPNQRHDLTPFGGTLLAALASLLVGSILSAFFGIGLSDNLISAGFAIIFAGYIAYDTQKIVGGKHHKYSYSPKEYILASLNLYQDVLNFYIHVVKLLDKQQQRSQSQQQQR